MIREERIRKQFAEMVSIDSPSFGERKLADYVSRELEALGFQVYEDQAGEHYGSDTGNIYGFLKGTVQGDPLLFSAHMDTVEPSRGKKAVFQEDGKITSAGDTVLGSDDVAGIVEILEGIRHLKEEGIAHRDIEVLFPIAEELYIKGTKVFDFERIHAREAYVLDMSGEPGAAAVKAPTLISFTVTVHGKASHAGFAPEEGVHALQIMCRAIDGIRQGRIDEETTLNIGMIQGGCATNIVPEQCVCRGELRSYSHRKALDQLETVRRSFEKAVEDTKASFELESSVDLIAYETERDSAVVQRFIKSCERLNLSGTLTSTFGGSDNNNFAAHGIQGIVLSCGMNETHSVREYTTIQELVTGAKLVAELILTV
jgi:tripeptide aminopeptidase